MKLIGYKHEYEKRWYITKIIGEETDITLPDTIDGNNYSIWKYALAGNYTINTLRVSSDIIGFQAYAFAHSSLKYIYCGKLTPPAIVAETFANLDQPITVYVPIGSRTVYESAGAWMTAQSTGQIKIAESLEVDTKLSIIPPLYYYKTKLTGKEITIPKEVTNIGRMAYFRTNPSKFIIEASGNKVNYLEWDGEVIKGANTIINRDMISENAFNNIDKASGLPSAITLTSERINQLSFQQQTSIQTVTIGAGVEFIAFNAFQGCTGLTNINVEADNKYYETKTLSGVQYLVTKEQENKDNELLWVAPKPANIDADTYNNAINQILLNTKIKRINPRLFFNNKNIYNLVIPAAIETIGYQAFIGCSNLCLIEFAAGRLKPAELQDYCFYDIGTSQSGITIIFPDMPVHIGHRALAFGTNTNGQVKAHLIIPANREGTISTIQKYSFEQGKTDNRKAILEIDIYGNQQLFNIYKNNQYWQPYFSTGVVNLIEDYPIATLSGDNGLAVEQDNDIASISFDSNIIFNSSF